MEEDAHLTTNMDRELSTILSIMDELEDEAVLEASAFDKDLDEVENEEDEEPGEEEAQGRGLMCAPCAPTAEGPVGSSVASTGPSQLALSSVGAISGLSGLATGYLCFQCKCKTGNCLLELKGSQLRAAYAQ